MNTKIKDFTSIENKLDSFLQPVNPEESFAANLKNRLLIEPNITIEKPDYLYGFCVNWFDIFYWSPVCLATLSYS